MISAQPATAISNLQSAPSRTEPTRSAAKIRVCHVSMCLLTGGLERLLVEFGRQCRRDDFDLRFVALDGLGVPAEELSALGYSVASVAGAVTGKVARLKYLARLFRSEQIQVVHSHNTLAHFYAAAAAKLAGVPVVVNTQHGRGCGESWKARLQFRIANQFSDRVIGVSEDAANLCRNDDRRSAGKIETIWNGIDLQRFTYRGPAATASAISVARLSPEKDFATLLRAVWIVRRDYPDFRLRIVGDGQERQKLEQIANEFQLTNNVEFLGERSDIPELLSQAGFFVSSSLSEGISLTLLEAMAVGLPIVTTSVGGNPEIVVDGKTGRLVPSDSPEQLASAIRQMLLDQEAWPVMGELARQRVEQHFDVRGMVRQYEELYSQLLQDRDAR